MYLIGLMGLLAQAGVEVTEAGSETSQSLFSLLLHANWVVQLTLLILLAFSVVCWAIIGSKYKQLKKIKRRDNHFFQQFWQSESVDALLKRKFQQTPAVSILKAGVEAVRDDRGYDRKALLQREVRRAYEDEVDEMEYGVPFLATTGSAAPFIGLFGTVWGILNAFWKIGRTGASSLAIVGPHIAEALIATAIGLAAAIPAVIFYNHYVNRIRILSKDLNDFSDDLIVRLEREYPQGA